MKKMKQKHNFIEINGRRYDAGSGIPLDHATTATKVSQTVSVPVRIVEPASTAPPKTQHPARRPAKDVQSHVPQPARTLMRQAVSKPQPVEHKRPLKAAGRLDLPPSSAAIIVKPAASHLDNARLRHAQHIKRSHLISRFDRRQLMAGPDFVTSFTVTTSPVTSTPATAAKISTAASKHPKTTADVLEMALQNATSHLQRPVKPEPRHRVWHRHHVVPVR
jgi:hypothetical protein